MTFKTVTVDGTTTEVSKMSLEEMQKFVGGYIEYAPKHLRFGHKNIICSEEGVIYGLPQNKAYPAFVGNIIIEEPNKRKPKEI